MGFRKLLRQPQSIFAFIYRHKYTALFVYIYTLNAKNTINNSYINFRIVFPAQISESFFRIVFATQILKSFLPRKNGDRFSKSFLLGKFQDRFFSNRFCWRNFGIVFALQILKSFLPRKMGIVFLCRVLRSFLR